MATNMLNIEESVNNELEYQLLSGKRLVDVHGNSLTEQLRIAKVTNNANKIAEATTQIFESQRDVLEGNDFFAKEALAKTMGMTTEQLMKAHETQKLIKSIPEFQGKEGKDKLDRLLQMKPEEFQKEIADMPKEQKALYEKIKQDSDTRTSDQQLLELLDYKRTFKITEIAGDQVSTITGAQKTILDEDGIQKQMGEFLDSIARNATIVQQIGGKQLKAEMLQDFSTALGDFAKVVPLLGDEIKKLLEGINAYTQKILGAATVTNKPDGGGANDAVLVNDAMIQFHPADKFATVPDGAALLASTERGKLDTAVDTLTGGGGKTAVVDPLPIARAVAAEIKNAMAGMRLELDGFNLKKALEFSNRTINRI
jgi:hypothetical protein